jgi:hypothetical protein
VVRGLVVKSPGFNDVGFDIQGVRVRVPGLGVPEYPLR